MTTVAHGPYEHVGAYADLAESEVFDTSGTPIGFCPECQHAPCVAGANTWCRMTPHSSTVWRMVEEIRDAIDFSSPHALLLLGLLDTVGFVASAGERDLEQETAQRRIETELLTIRQASAANGAGAS